MNRLNKVRDHFKETEWLSSKVLNPKSCAKNRFAGWVGGNRCGAEAGHIALRGSSAGCGGAGAAAAPRPCGAAIGRAPAPSADWAPRTCEAYPPPPGRLWRGALISRALPSPHHSDSGRRRVQASTSVALRLRPLFRLRRNLRCLDCYNFSEFVLRFIELLSNFQFVKCCELSARC